MKRLNCWHILAFFLTPYILLAEGTRQLTPSSTDNGHIQIFDNNTLTRPFATFDCPEEHRLNFSICNLGEKVFFGFRQNDKDVYFRIKDPDGQLVEINGNTINQVPTSGAGYIANYSQAYNGPSAVVGTAGYNALSFTPTKTGDYYVEFNPKRNGKPATEINPVKRVFSYFDITVTTASNVIIPGRLWSKAWDLQCNGGNNPFNGLMYIYSDDGIVTSLNFNGMMPFGFVVFANSSGLRNTGNSNSDRQSANGNINYPQYKIFLNDPDIDCYPTGTFGNLTQASTVSGCSETDYCINVYTDQSGTIEILLDFEAPAGFQPNTRDRIISVKDAIAGHNCVRWDGRDGKGAIVTPGREIDMEVNFLNGLTHLPLFDVEFHPKGYIVSLVRPTGPPPMLYWDDTQVGGGMNLTGCLSTNGCHTWPASGSGFGNERTINTWWHAQTVKDKLLFTSFDIVVDANGDNGVGNNVANDTTICDATPVYQLNGVVINALGGEWSTSGTGTFSDITDLKGTYTLSAQDIANGQVTLTLTTTGTGLCPPQSDQLVLRIDNLPTITTSDVEVCANNAVASLSASAANTSGITWSGGSGSFNNTTIPNPRYTPTPAEIAAGSVDLTITTSGNGVCAPQSSQVKVSFSPMPEIQTTSPLSICRNNTTVNLSATISVASGIIWSGGNGGFSAPNSLNTTYTPTNAEINTGSVTLRATTTGNGNCLAVSENITVNFTNPPIVNAGTNLVVCNTNTEISLNGQVTGSSNHTWSGGSGTFDDAGALQTTYHLTANDISSGKVILYLESSESNCIPVRDSLQITFTSAPGINIGNDLSVCGNNPSASLQAQLTGATQVLWEGFGTFSNNTSINTVYTPSSFEISLGLSSVIASTTDNGICPPAKDTLIISIAPAPTANAGSDMSICKNNPSISLNGSVGSGATGQQWIGGGGVFIPNRNALNATYIPTANELSAGSLRLVLSASKTSCNNVTDTLVITFTDAPVVNAGPDQSICINNPVLNLNGSVSGATGGSWSGPGSFNPGSGNLNGTYTASESEITAGSIELVLTSTGNGNCNAVTDTLRATFTPAPTANAGSDFSVCSNNSDIALTGSVTIATGGAWSGGNGTYVPNQSTLATTYLPTPSEISSGSVTLTLTTTGNGNCQAVTDQVTVTFTNAPSISASDITICADNPVANLSGSITVASGGSWSGGNGAFGNTNSLSTTYTPTPAEIATGSVNLTLTTSGNGTCNSVSEEITVNILPVPTIDAGANQTVCGNVNNVQLNASVTNATGVVWTVAKGHGTLQNANSLNAIYRPANQDRLDGAVTLKATSTGNGVCRAVSDSMVITFTVVPTVDAGNNQTVCSNDLPVQLDGSGSAAVWSGGNGTFSPSANDPKATYMPAPSEVGATVVLTLTTIPSGACPTISDQVSITIPRGPVSNAGANTQICGNSSTINLAGQVTNASGGIWTHNGNGSIANPTTLNTTYQIHANDRAAGRVEFILTTTGNAHCSSASDTFIVSLTPELKVNAGPDQSVCADISSINLSGTMENAGGVQWTSSGTGSFSNAASLATTYTPSQADRILNTLTFTLTTTNNGICTPIADQVVYTITPAPTVNAGSDISICGDSARVALNGSYTIAGGVIWSTSGSGAFTPGNTQTNTSYVPSEADKTAGEVRIILTTTDNGTCQPVRDTLVLAISDIPTASAGADTTLCADAGTLRLNGKVSGAGSGIWTTSGTGYFNNPNLLNSIYTFSSEDSLNGVVTLTLTTMDNGLCKAVYSQRIVTLTPAPTLTVVSPMTICADAGSVTANSSVTVAQSVTWTTSGTGMFADPTSLSPTYFPSDADTASGLIYLIATTTGNGLCNAISDSVELTIAPAPVVIAGADQTICADSAMINLAGIVHNAYSGTWHSSGTGSFVPKFDTTVTSYMPSTADRAHGQVTLTLTSYGHGTCNPVSDELVLIITPAPTVDAGYPSTVCADTAYIQLNGSLTVATSANWASSGSGVFIPDASSLNGRYVPGEDDILAGKIYLTLTTTDNGQCRPKSSTIEVTVNPAPIVNAGADRVLCADVTSIPLNGQVQIAGGGIWSSIGTGYFSPSDTDLNASYIPSSADTANGSVRLILTSSLNGLCKPVSDTVLITFTPQPIVMAGSDSTICADYTGVRLDGTVIHAAAAIWSTSGTGYFSPSATHYNATYVPSTTDKTAGLVTLTLTTTSMKTCNAVSDHVSIAILPAPIVNAGEDMTICADAEAAIPNATVTNAGGGIWTTSGTGYFSPSANTIDARYVYSEEDIANRSVMLTLTSDLDSVCTSVSDNLIVNIDPLPKANAGPDQTICKDIDQVSLNAAIQNAGGGFWTSSGTGTFSDDENLATNYIPSQADTAAGSVTLSLTTTQNGSCNFTSSHVLVTFTDIPTVSVADDATICADAKDVSISGHITVASGGQWSSSGDGSFSPSVNALNAKYHPGPADKTNGTVTLTMVSTGNGTCKSYNDQMTIVIQPEPVVDAGSDITICADTAGVQLNGVIANASDAVWSTGSGSGSFTPSANDLNAIFRPSAAQIAAGRANLTLTTLPEGACSSRNDVVVINITPAPTLVAGSDLMVCTGLPLIDLSASYTVATGVSWSGGLGSFSDATTAMTTYAPHVSENTAGNTISVFVTTTGNGLCKALTETINISFSALPPIEAGNDMTVCDSDLPISLTGSGSPGTWIGGTGTFSPSRNSLHATYQPAAAEVASGSIKLHLQTINDGLCAPGVDSIVIVFEKGPELNAGTEQFVCANEEYVQLNATANYTNGIIWNAEGTGTFQNNTVDNARYYFTPEDVVSGTILFTLTSPAFGNCKEQTDTVSVTFTPAPTINAGPDMSYCATIPTIQLNGGYTIATAGEWIVEEGTGSLNNNTSLAPIYTPSDDDRSNRLVRLRFETTMQGSCQSVFDMVEIAFTDGPSATAGSPIRICGDSAFVQLAGAVHVAQGGEWTSSGNGVFSPNRFSLGARYIPSASDIAANAVTLRLTTTGNGDCPAEYDEMTLTIDPIPTVTAGSDLTHCKDVTSISLNGDFTIAGGVSWNTSGSGSFSSASDKNANYLPSQNDKNSGSVILTITTTNNDLCKPVSDRVRVNFTPIPEIEAGFPQTICANSGAVELEAFIKIATGVSWTSPTHQAGFSDALQSRTSYLPDVSDLSNGSVLLTATTTGNGTCLPVNDTVRVYFTPAPTVMAGNDEDLCADVDNIQLGATYSIASGVLWSTSGSGVFQPSAVAANAIYIPSPQDTAARNITLTAITTGNGDCLAVQDALDVSFRPAPVVTAGADTEFCYDAGNIQLHGSYQNSAGVIWSTTSGGTLSDPTIVNPIYTFSPSEKANGTVIVKLTSTGNPDCKIYSDYVVLTKNPFKDIRVLAGGDFDLCSDAETVALNGYSENSGTIWSTVSSAGSFSNPNQLNAVYQISAADIAAGSVTFVLSSTDHDVCTAVRDTITMALTPIPTVTAGNDTTLCGDVGIIPIRGLVTVANGGRWTTSGNGLFTPTNTSLRPSYIPTAQDVQNGKVYLTLTTTGNGSCKAYNAVKEIILTTPPTVSAGPTVSICSDNERVSLNGSYTVAGSVQWTTSGTGTFSNSAESASYYLPSALDIKNKVVTLTLTTGDNGQCSAVSDKMNIRFTPIPTINAGLDGLFCSNEEIIPLSGVVSVAEGAIWTTSGNGYFTPGTSNLRASYHPSENDVAGGSVKLWLTSTGNGTCRSVQDSIVLSFAPAPVADAGLVTNCIFESGAILQGSVQNAGAGRWITSGTGQFSPNPFAANAVYYPSAQDFNTGKVSITYSTTGNGVCQAASSVLNFVVSETPTADAGPAKYVCMDESVTLAALSVPNYSYTWSDMHGNQISDRISMQANINADTSFVVKVTDLNGCHASDTAHVKAVVRPTLGLDPHYCFEPGMILTTDVQNVPPYSGIYTWFKDGSLFEGRQEPAIALNNPGVYTISYTVGNCITQRVAEVTAPPVLVTPSKITCIDQNIDLVTSKLVGHSYSWYYNNNRISTQYSTIIKARPDTNKYVVSVTDPRGCVSIDSAYIVGVVKPDPMLRDTTLCEGTEVALNARPRNLNNPDLYNIVYKWLHNGQYISGEAEYVTGNTGIHKVEISIDYCIVRDSAEIRFNPAIKPFLPEQAIFCENDSSMTLDASAAGLYGMTYEWSTGDKTKSILVNEPGVYYVKAINGFNCSLVDSIVVISNCGPNVHIPTAIHIGSEHKEGDETFTIFGKYFDNFAITIFNRWGEIIFYSNDPKKGWDGHYRGEPMPSGVYPYLITYKGTNDGKSYQKEGLVTIIR